MNNKKNILEKIKYVSSRNIENPSKLEEYVGNPSIPITFFNWECPPRYIKSQKGLQEYVSFDVDMKKINRCVPVDVYTEMPRVLTKKADEIKIINFLKSLGINFRFVKIIADTNAAFLYPDSIRYDGTKVIKDRMEEFRTLISEQLVDYPCETETLLFWDLLKENNLQKKYCEAFDFAYKNLLKINQTLLPSEYFAKQIQRTKEHIGIFDKKWATDLSARTMATYGAEGVVLEKLSKSRSFSNCVWLNIEEVSDRAIRITNFLREQNGVTSLPMIFPSVDLLCKEVSNNAV